MENGAAYADDLKSAEHLKTKDFRMGIENLSGPQSMMTLYVKKWRPWKSDLDWFTLRLLEVGLLQKIHDQKLNEAKEALNKGHALKAESNLKPINVERIAIGLMSLSASWFIALVVFFLELRPSKSKHDVVRMNGSVNIARRNLVAKLPPISD